MDFDNQSLRNSKNTNKFGSNPRSWRSSSHSCAPRRANRLRLRATIHHKARLDVMANLKNWILLEADGQPIIAVTIGRMGWDDDYNSENVPNYDNMPKNKVLPWEEAERWLDYEFHSGYGAPGCQAIYAWTQDRVIFVSQYDGATSIRSIPRSPCDEEPIMPGG